MKVFNYTNGVKGELLGETYRPSWMTGHLRDGNVYANRNGGYQFHFGAGSSFKGKDTPIDPKEFGVEAICFCSGQYTSGDEAGKWVWHTLYTEEGFQAALAAGTVYVKESIPRPRITIPVWEAVTTGEAEAAARLLFGVNAVIEWDEVHSTLMHVTPAYVGVTVEMV